VGDHLGKLRVPAHIHPGLEPFGHHPNGRRAKDAGLGRIQIGFELVALAEAGAIEAVGVYDLDRSPPTSPAGSRSWPSRRPCPVGLWYGLAGPDRDRLRAELEHDLARFLAVDQSAE
jgi:hypothetical protein